MDGILQSQVFFFISSIGFIVLWIFASIFLYYLIRSFRTFHRILDKVEKDIDHIGDTTKEMLEEVKDSVAFNFLFRGKKKHKKKIT